MKKIRALWKTLGRSIYVGDRLRDNLRALAGVSLVTALLGIVLIVMNLVNWDPVRLIPSILTFLGGAGCAVCSWILKKREWAIWFPALFCTVMFTFYAINGMGEGTAVLWSLLMPIGLCYFVSVRFGVVLSLYHAVLYAVLFYTPLRDFMADSYSVTFMDRFPLVYMGIAAFTAIAMIQYHKSALFEIDYTEQLHAEVEKQTRTANERARRLELLSEEMVETLATTIDAKDKYTNGHSFRVMEYAMALAKETGMDAASLSELRREALLHDVGKIGIPDEVLNKPAVLSREEFDVIKSHTVIGARILSKYNDLADAADVAKYHHERYDGGGYPEGLAGEAIPLHARIVSVADAFDAMNSSRVYRKALPRDRIRRELETGRGAQFDPVLVDAFLRLMDRGEV